MKYKNEFSFWYKGHQILAVLAYDCVFHFYIGLVDPIRVSNMNFYKYVAENVDNASTIEITSEFKEPYANKNLYSMHAVSFFSTKQAGIEVALHLCEAISYLDYPEKDFKEFNFTV